MIRLGIGPPDHDRVAALTEVVTVAGERLAVAPTVVGTDHQEVGGLGLGQRERGGGRARFGRGRQRGRVAGHHDRGWLDGVVERRRIDRIDGDELALRQHPLPGAQGGRRREARERGDQDGDEGETLRPRAAWLPGGHDGIIVPPEAALEPDRSSCSRAAAGRGRGVSRGRRPWCRSPPSPTCTSRRSVPGEHIHRTEPDRAG